MRFLVLIVLTLVISQGNALACSCGSWSNFYRGAASDGAQVAVLKTLKKNKYGEIEAELVRSFRGSELSTGETFTLNGQDGLNCAGSMSYDTNQNWIAVFRKGQDGRFSTLSCASTALSLNDQGVSGPLFDGGSSTVTEIEFENLLAGALEPTVTLECSLAGSDSSRNPSVNVNTSASANADGVVNIKETQKGLTLWLNASQNQWDDSISLNFANVADSSVIRSSYMVDGMRPTPHISASVVSQDYKKSTRAQCSLTQGLPLK